MRSDLYALERAPHCVEHRVPDRRTSGTPAGIGAVESGGVAGFDGEGRLAKLPGDRLAGGAPGDELPVPRTGAFERKSYTEIFAFRHGFGCSNV